MYVCIRVTCDVLVSGIGRLKLSLTLLLGDVYINTYKYTNI